MRGFMLTTIRRDPGLDQSRKVRSDGSENRPTRPQSIWVPNPISKTRSGSTQRAGGEQCAPILVKVRHGLMTADRRSPTLTDDEGKIKSNQTPLIPEKPIN
jgi:hypothetical protein